MKPDIQIPLEWHNVLNLIEANPRWRKIYIIGATDTGKSTLCQFLHRNLIPQFATAYLDCDPGQSLIGTPTTVGLQYFHKGHSEAAGIDLCFVGAPSPQGHMLQTLVGIQKLLKRAFHYGINKIIIDSSGFVLGKPAQEFQFLTIDLLRPDILILIERSDELKFLYRNFNRTPRLRIIRLSASPLVQPRSPEERRRYRMQKFREYFQAADYTYFSYKNLGLHGMIPDLRNPELVRHRLIALCDAQNFVLSLAIIQKIHYEDYVMKLYTPPFKGEKVATVQFGSIYLPVEELWANE